MGCDIHYMVQIQKAPGVWVCRPDWKFFDGRSYSLFSVLADVRNSGGLPYISKPRGFPEDIQNDINFEEQNEVLGRWLGDHHFTCITLEELLTFDYDQEVFNDNFGEVMPLKEFLPDEYFRNLQVLQYEMKYSGHNLLAKDVRILIGFDN